MSTQAQIIAADHAANLGGDLIARIRRIATRAGFVSVIGLSVSMPHQMAFIISLVHLKWTGIQQALLSLTVVAAAVGIPVMVDLLILNCIDTIATRGMDADAKKFALRLIWYPISISGAANVLAPAPWQLRVGLAIMVTLIPAAEALRSKARANFREIHEIEAAAGIVADQASNSDSAQSERADRAARIAKTRERVASLSPYQLSRYKSMTSYQRRRYLAQLAEKEAAIAPTSPAPAGMHLVRS
jgi:hypothetical protein